MSKYSHKDLGWEGRASTYELSGIYSHTNFWFPPKADLRWTFKQKDLMIRTVARIRMRGRRRNTANAELLMPPASTEGQGVKAPGKNLFVKVN